MKRQTVEAKINAKRLKNKMATQLKKKTGDFGEKKCKIGKWIRKTN